MSHFLEHAEYYNKPARLTKEELADPFKVIDRFFWGFPLYEIRDIIWLMATALISRKDYVIRYDAEDLFCFYEQLEKMLEAALILLNNKDALAKP